MEKDSEYKPLTRAEIESYPDGTWIETDQFCTRILHTWPMDTPQPDGVYLWRRKQLMDQLGFPN
jgi:hypothetical protein